MIHDLIDIDVSDYAFISEEIAQKVCHKLELIFVSLARLKRILNFEETKIKSITHQILLKMILQNHFELSISLFIIKINQHSFILNKSWMNRHEVILNMISDECYFTSNHCDHVEASSLLNRSAVSQKLFDSVITLYLSSSKRSLTSHLSMSVQKYQILQRRSLSTSLRVISSRSTIEDWNEEDQASKKSLSSNSRYAIEKIEKKYSSKRLFKEERRVKIIREAQKSSLLNVSVRRSNLIKKSTRRSSKRFKAEALESKNDEQNLDSDTSLNVVFIDATAFQSLVESKERRKKVKTFSLIMKKLNELIDNVKENLVKMKLDLDLNLKEVLKIMKAIVEKLKHKISDFLKRFESVLNLKKVDKLSSHRVYDHKIELTKDSNQLSRNRIYSLSLKKFEILQKYLHENLQKEFINLNKTFYVSFILFVVKSNEQLRLCVDYRKLNVIIKRNSYSISLIEKTLTRVIDCKFLFKLNIISIFNKLRMNSQSENLIIFICSLNIYKYHVLFFELINDSISWQHYMNDLLFEYINHFCQVYLNDIFIYSKTRKQHERHLTQIFQKLEKADFQIDIKKCEFFQTEISFLDVILSTEDLRMNSKKMQNIVNWVRSTYIKKMQTFVDFCNFYRRFIKVFSKLVKFLTRMIKKKIDFEWIDLANEAFEILKKQMIETSILRHYDRNRKTILKIDFSNWCLDEVLSQYDDDEVLHSIAFFNKKIISAECNYEIYDKKLLVIIRCLKHWRFELENIDEFVEIYIDHKSLKIFMTSKKLTSRQIRWVKILIDNNIKIQYQFEVKNVKTNVLTRMFEFRLVDDDERELYREQVLLSFSRLQLCSIDAQNDLYERIMQINRKDENCISHRQTLTDEQIINEEVSLRDCFDRNEVLFKNENLWMSDQLDLMIEIIRDAHD